MAAAGGLAWWLVHDTAPPPRPTGDFDVYVVGGEAMLHNGTVHVAGADALKVLLALGDARGFTVAYDDLAGCAYDYVHGVAGLGESGTGGWNYYLRRDGGDWDWQPRSASCPGLQSGDDVLWCWVEPDEVCAVYP